MKTIPSLEGQRRNSFKLVLIGIATLLLASCAVPYDTTTYIEYPKTSTSAKGDKLKQPINVYNIQRIYRRPAYVAPGYHSYSSYYNCRPYYYRRGCWYQRQGCFREVGLLQRDRFSRERVLSRPPALQIVNIQSQMKKDNIAMAFQNFQRSSDIPYIRNFSQGYYKI